MRSITGAAAIIAIALLAAYSATQYVIGTRTGQLIVSNGEPELDKKTNRYRFRDADGKDMAINAAAITQIIQR